jgi:hypothetical protein
MRGPDIQRRILFLNRHNEYCRGIGRRTFRRDNRHFPAVRNGKYPAGCILGSTSGGDDTGNTLRQA